MNGPTRSSTFDRRSPVRPSPSRASADAISELDQFVDSEPVVWAPSVRRRQRMLPPEQAGEQNPGADSGALPGDTSAAGHETSQGDDTLDAAFSREAASPRRDAFAKRLSEELARPPEPKVRREPARAAEPAPAVPQAESAPDAGPPAAKPRSLATPTTARPAEEARRPAPAPVAAAEPQDALDWELDNAIGAIIASGRFPDSDAAVQIASQALPTVAEAPGRDVERPEPRQPARQTATPPAAPVASPPAPAAPRAEPRAFAPEPQAKRRDVTPVAPVGTPRRKPVPTFRFDRREEPDDPVPVVARDVDDPLANVFFDDVRQAFDAVHPGANGGDLPETLSELDADAWDPPTDDDDELPPSLVRAAGPLRERRRSWRSSGVAAAVVGIAGLALVAVIGMNVFAGPGSSGDEPPIIRADARDVKVAPEAGADTAEVRPDIAESAALGDSDRLVLPDSVAIADVAEPDPDALEEELVSRRVRTVVVRPDGTIVPAEPSNEAAAAAVGSAAVSAPSEVLAGEGFGDDDVAADIAPFDDSDLGVDDGVPIEVARADVAGEVDAIDGAPDLAPTPALDADGSGAANAAIPRPRPPVPPAASRPATQTASRTPSEGAGQEPLALQPSSAAAARPAAPAVPWSGTAGEAASAPAAAADANAPWAVQLASQRSRADAEASLANLRRRYPSLVGGANPMIVAANVDNRGTFYRVRLPAGSRGEAATLCQRLKDAGADCFIGRN